MFRKATAPAPVSSVKPGAKSGDLLSPTATSSPSNNGGNAPLLGQVNPLHLMPGTKVWVADPKVLWRIGEVQAVSSEEQTAQVYLPDASDAKVQTLALGKLFSFDASHVVDHEDVALMNNMHEAPLLHVLRQRFEADAIYTFTADILLSINPYKTVPLLYDVMGFMEQRNNAPADSVAPPHLFTVAEKAYKGMKGAVPGSGAPQSIIISGESGAGKTEASKYIMKYLAAASKYAMLLGRRGSLSGQPAPPSVANGVSAATNIHEKIEECVVLSNLILESFGNSKTSRNDNSSRFGKYIQIHYNADGRMVGVSIRHFLLEKTRLVMTQAHERNYHVFYQLLAGLDKLEQHCEQRRRPLRLLPDAWNYPYLTRGDCVEVDGVDDAVEFDQLQQCLEQLGMDRQSFQLPMFEVLAAILHLGNVQFQASGQAGNNSDDEATAVVFPESDRGVDLEHVSMLLGVDAREFASKMVTQTMVTGRGSFLEMHLAPEQAKNAMDAFCKYLYGELFHHLIGSINARAKEQTRAAAGAGAGASDGAVRRKSSALHHGFIGILDIFGFEVMARNSLEQLCINFTNEMLQQQFNKHVFVLEQERYAREGIAFSAIEFKDNQACLDLIQKPPSGLLPLLEEQLLLKRKTTDKQLLTIYHGAHLDRHASYAKPRFECDEFIIRHYAGDVTYDIHEFLAKNTDNLHDDLLDLLRRSSHPLLRDMFHPTAAAGASRTPVKRPGSNSSASSTSSSSTSSSSTSALSGSLKRQQGTALTGATTVSSRFRTQLGELMEVLWRTTPNYVKCVKPNNLKFPGGFSCELVRDQLVYSGVLEVVRIRQEGFPIRKRFDDFYELFWPLAVARRGAARSRADPSAVQAACEFIAAEWLDATAAPGRAGAARKVFAVGRSEIFLRYGQLERLDAFLAATRDARAAVLQSKLVRARLARERYRRLRRGAVLCQAQWRMRVLRRRFRRQRAACVAVQTRTRGFHARRRFLRRRAALERLWRALRRVVARRRLARTRLEAAAAAAVQRVARGFLCRTSAERARKLRARSALALQSWLRMARVRRAFLGQQRAATRLQTRLRGARQRRRFVALKRAAVALAAWTRQLLQRRKFKRLKQRVVAFQALVRGWKLRHRFLRLRRAALRVQRARRRRRALLALRARTRAVAMLQLCARAWRVRGRYVRLQACVRALQHWARGWLQRRDFRRARRAARRVQRSWRRVHRRRRWEAEVASVFGGARSAPLAAWTPHSKMEDSDRRIQRLRQQPRLFFSLQPRAFAYNSLFHHAAACGDLHVVRFMLDHHPFARDAELLLLRNGRGHTALHEACAGGQYEVVKLLASLMQLPKEAPEPQAPEPQAPEPQQTPPPPSATAAATDRVVLYSGYLRKRRETSRWMRRFVVLSRSPGAGAPQLDYYANDKPQTLRSASAKAIDLGAALFKKSTDTPFAFEVHSPALLRGRNKEGRLYFAAEDELGIQTWLAHLRDNLPSSIESRLFAMHRASKYGALEFIDFGARKAVCSLPSASGRHARPLHLVAACRVHDGGGGRRRRTTSAKPPLQLDAADSRSDNNAEENEEEESDDALAGGGGGGGEAAVVGRSKLDVEADVVKTALWLVENGADVNAATSEGETPLQLALRAGNLLVAKHLLDRGALATGLSAAEMAEAQRLKAALTRNAISSVGSGPSHAGAAPSIAKGARMLTSSLKLKLQQAAAAVVSGGHGHGHGHGASSASAAATDGPATPSERELPLLFLLKQPGKVRHSSYVSVFVELVGLRHPQALRRPRIVISVLDTQRRLVEMRQQVSTQPLVASAALVWAFTWHMQTPLENLPLGACVVFELAVSPPLPPGPSVTSPASRTSSSSLSSSAASSHLVVPAPAADDFAPVCWTYIQVDQRTANCMPLSAEMYKYPMNLSLKRLARFDAFLTGDVLVSQGPTD